MTQLSITTDSHLLFLNTDSQIPKMTSISHLDPVNALPDQANPNNIQLIYAGGTFGSYGKPLAALPAETFLPLLMDKVHQDITPHIEVLPNQCVKDSSQLSPVDLTYFYDLILSRYATGQKQFVIITGTDTLSYFGSFLAEAFAGSDICIILTASMRPLFDANDIHNYRIDPNSDAWDNLVTAIGLSAHGAPGVYIGFANESWPAQTVQKIHSHDLMAFTGHSRAGYPATSYVKSMSNAQQSLWVTDAQDRLATVKDHAFDAVVATIYCVPNNSDWMVTQLKDLLNLPPAGVILIGFGAGNLPYSKAVACALDDLYRHGHLLVCTTQCPYGGVSDAYAAGSWQYDHHVLSAGRLTIPAVYARLLWLHLAYDTPARRRQRWRYSVTQS